MRSDTHFSQSPVNNGVLIDHVRYICSDMKKSERRMQESFRSQCARPFFGLWCAPIFPTAPSKDGAKAEQGLSKGGHLAKSPKSLVHPLHKALLSAHDTIERLTRENVTLREENARLTLKEQNISKALEDLTNLNIQAKKEREEVEARIKNMEENFQKEKKIWQDLSKHQLGEIRRFKISCLVAESHSQRMEEEVRESKLELFEGRRQVERKITSLEQSLHIQKEDTLARLSAMEGHWREMIRIRKENAASKPWESEERWQRRVSQLEEELKEKRSLDSNLIDKIDECRNIMTLWKQNQPELYQSEKKWESKCKALEESYRRELSEKEESWQRTVQDMERRYELEKMWLQKDEEWRKKTNSLEEEVKRLTEENTQLQESMAGKQNQKPWWKRRIKIWRRTQSDTSCTSEETVASI
uniref:golgin subfamily A member 6-like protein 6 n=1 Tax=Scatophagus argus TaxID=75038 RepID=UPI001ED7DD05|nr:golgin subfamily A member 6-like protein 6 [Scatophagus argus]